MKHIFFAFSLFLFASCATAQIPEEVFLTDTTCKIAGGAGFVKTYCNPNYIASLRVIDQRLYSSFAYDTLAQRLYYYNRLSTIGGRWKWLRFDTTGSTGAIFDTSRIIWNGGNYDIGGITIGTKQAASINFLINNTIKGRWSNSGLAIGQTSTLGHSFLVNGTARFNAGVSINEPLTAIDYSQILLRNPQDNYIYKASMDDILERGSYITNVDTLTSWAGRVYDLGRNSHDVVINARYGTQTVNDSMVFNLDFVPRKGQEITIYVQGGARLWVMDMIFRCPYGATNNYSYLEEGNASTDYFSNQRVSQCIEFGLTANNTKYNQDQFFNVQQGTVFKIMLKYNSIDKKWLVTKIGTMN